MTMDEYLAAPLVADPLSRYDCVPVVAGAQAIVVTHPDRCRAGRAPVRVRAHRASFNYDNQEGDGLRPASARLPASCGRAAGVRPERHRRRLDLRRLSRPWCWRSSTTSA
jgi:acetyl-CoA acetyltransferase